MKLSAVIATLFATATAAYAAGLQIDTTYKPDDCPLQSKKGDQLSMQ